MHFCLLPVGDQTVTNCYNNAMYCIAKRMIIKYDYHMLNNMIHGIINVTDSN